MEQEKELYELLEEELTYIKENKEKIDDNKIQEFQNKQVKKIEKIFKKIELDNKNYIFNLEQKQPNLNMNDLFKINSDFNVKRLQQFFKEINFKNHIETYTHIYANNSLQIAVMAVFKNSARNLFVHGYKGVLNSDINFVTNLVLLLDHNEKLHDYNKFHETLLNKELFKRNLTFKYVSDINWQIENFELFGEILSSTFKAIPKIKEKELNNYLKKYPNSINELQANRISITELLSEIINQQKDDTLKDLQKLEKRILEDKTSTPIDRVNSMLWNKNYIDKNHNQPLINGIPNGQLSIAVGKGLKNSDQSIFINLDLSQTENYKLSKNLDAIDFTTYTAIANLWNDGNFCVTLEDIYYKMYGSREMATTQKERLLQTINKLMQTQIIISNSTAIKNGMENYTLLEYKGSLLPGALTKRAYRGRAVDCFERSYAPSYKILPLFDLAIASNNAIITLPDEAYILPFTATDRNLQLRNYLMSNILAEHKNIVIKNNGKSKTATKENRNEWKPKKLKLDTLYRVIGVTKETIEHSGTLNRTKKDILKNTEILLKQWSKQKYISKYEITDKYLTIYY